MFCTFNCKLFKVGDAVFALISQVKFRSDGWSELRAKSFRKE